jgi:hypothetical protein
MLWRTMPILCLFKLLTIAGTARNFRPLIFRFGESFSLLLVWTAELTMVHAMQKWDAIPADDLGLKRVIVHYYCKDEKITSTQARQIGKS